MSAQGQPVKLAHLAPRERLWLSTRSPKSYLGPKSIVPTKQCRALNLWITSSSPFPARLRRFFELLQPCGRETRRQLDPPPPRKKNSPVYRLLKPLRHCFVVLRKTGYDGPVKRHTVATPFPSSRRWWESALYPGYYLAERSLQTTNPAKGLGCRPG